MKRINPFAVEDKKQPWFVFGISMGIMIAMLIWWLLKEKSINKNAFPKKVELIVLTDQEEEKTEELSEPDEEESQKVSGKVSSTSAPDDLKVIDGIGPRSAEVLAAAGVTSFTQLSGMDPDSIQNIMREAGVRIPYPETWPEQAALAAAEKWVELEVLQETLQRGRRV